MKTAKFIVFPFTILMSIIIIASIVFTGVSDFFALFWNTTLRQVLGVTLLVGAVSLVSGEIVRHKKTISGYDEPDDYFEDSFDPDADKGLNTTQCTKCGKEEFYFSESAEAPVFLICWKCQKELTMLWCQKCGVGGNFARKIGERPMSWKCPECKQVYELPENFYDTPVKLLNWLDLPARVRKSFFERQKIFQLNQARFGVWFLGSIVISFLMAPPVLIAFFKLLEKLVLHPVNSLPEPLFIILKALGWVALFVGLWYSLIFYPAMLSKLFMKLKKPTDDGAAQ